MEKLKTAKVVIGIESYETYITEDYNRSSILQDAINQLEYEERKLIQMYIDGYSLNDLAKTFGLSKTMTSKKLKKILEEIKNYIEDNYIENNY